MRAGELREPIIIERRVGAAPDALGEQAPQWEAYARAFAAVSGARGREAQGPGQEFGERKLLVRTRIMDGVSSAMRVRWRGRVLDIISVEPDARGWMDLFCREAE